MVNEPISVRGLIDSDFDNPLRQFTGTFDGCEKVPASGYEGWRVNMNFRDIDNVVVAPGFVYNFPTAVLNFPYSNKKKTKWGYCGDSLASFLPPDEDIVDCKGRVMTLVFCDGQDGRPEPKPIWNRDASTNWKHAVQLETQIEAIKKAGSPLDALAALEDELNGLGEVYRDGMVPTPVWIVAGMEGATGGVQEDSGGSAADWAEEHLVGLTRAQFNKWAFADPKVRKDVALQRSISDKSFVNSLVQLGKVVEDEDGVFQLPAEE